MTVFLREAFEGSEADVLNNFRGKHLAGDHSLQLVSSPSYFNKSGAFTLRKTDRDITVKADLLGEFISYGSTRYYGFAIFIPMSFQFPQGPTVIIFQVHDNATPPMTIDITPGTYSIAMEVNGTSNEINSGVPVKRGQWVEVIVGCKTGSNGFIEVYVDGTRIDRRTGTVGTAGKNPYSAYGIYLPRLRRTPEKYTFDSVTFYYDNIIEASTFAEVDSYLSADGGEPSPTNTLSLSSPAEGSSYTSTQAVQFTASPSGATVDEVRFFANGALIDAPTHNPQVSAPYEFSATLAPGSYAITAKSYNNGSLVASSNTRNIIVTGNVPSIKLVAPVDGEDLQVNQDYLLDADVFNVPAGTLVTFYRNITNLGSYSEPYQRTVNPSNVGAQITYGAEMTVDGKVYRDESTVNIVA